MNDVLFSKSTSRRNTMIYIFYQSVAVTPEMIKDFFKDVTNLATKLSCGQARYLKRQQGLIDSESRALVELYKEPIITVRTL